MTWTVTHGSLFKPLQTDLFRITGIKSVTAIFLSWIRQEKLRWHSWLCMLTGMPGLGDDTHLSRRKSMVRTYWSTTPIPRSPTGSHTGLKWSIVRGVCSPLLMTYYIREMVLPTDGLVTWIQQRHLRQWCPTFLTRRTEQQLLYRWRTGGGRKGSEFDGVETKPYFK